MQIDVLAQIEEKRQVLLRRLNEELAFEESHGFPAEDTYPILAELRCLERETANIKELYGDVQQLKWC
ncbi:MAG: hypothetical protein U9Q70_09095 [Chloroflexota bacterium]|nr:hypothetical protein [Chloroflexota bacterium]